MLKKFRLEDSKPMKTPMSTKTKLTKDEEGESVDNTKYRGIIGRLLYLTASRPDIMFSVCLCARFQEDPDKYGYIKNHKKTVKNGQARTRERKSAQKPEAKPRKSQPSVKQWSTESNLKRTNP
ncbi:hypothetical protein Tco_1579364 [Tanacetum coccineum]